MEGYCVCIIYIIVGRNCNDRYFHCLQKNANSCELIQCDRTGSQY